MTRQAYPFGWMAVALASVVALFLTHHQWHAGLLALALVVLHLDFVWQMAKSAKASHLEPAEPESETVADESEELAA